jgi:hypothetical protein
VGVSLVVSAASSLTRGICAGVDQQLITTVSAAVAFYYHAAWVYPALIVAGKVQYALSGTLCGCSEGGSGFGNPLKPSRSDVMAHIASSRSSQRSAAPGPVKAVSRAHSADHNAEVLPPCCTC